MTILVLTRLRKLPDNCSRCHYYVPRSWFVADVPVCSVMNEREIKGHANKSRQEWCPLIESKPCKTIVDLRGDE